MPVQVPPSWLDFRDLYDSTNNDVSERRQACPKFLGLMAPGRAIGAGLSLRHRLHIGNISYDAADRSSEGPTLPQE